MKHIERKKLKGEKFIRRVNSRGEVLKVKNTHLPLENQLISGDIEALIFQKNLKMFLWRKV